MNAINGMKVSLFNNENQNRLNHKIASSHFGMTQGEQIRFKKNKMSKWRSPSFNKLTSSNDKQQLSTLRSNGTQYPEFECGLRSEDSTRNKYTMNYPFIQNKEMLLFNKNEYETGYTPNRLGKGDFSNIKSIKDHIMTFPKTTKFLNHKSVPRELIQPECLMKTANCFNPPTLFQGNESFDFNQNKNQNYRSRSSMKTFGFPFLNSTKNKKLYLNLDQSQKEMLEDFFHLFNNKQHQLQKTRKNRSVNNITTFLDLTYKDNIPLTFPISISSLDDRLSKGEKNRYDKIIEELMKAKYLISLNKPNEKKIIKEFLIKHGVYNDHVVNDVHLANFGKFLQGEFNSINLNKTFKEIIIEATENNGHKDYKSIESSIEEHSFQTDESPIKSEQKQFKSSNILRASTQKQTKSKSSKIDIYDKLTLAKQKKLYENNSKGIREIAHDLEIELNKLKKENSDKRLLNRAKSSSFPKELLTTKSTLYLTQNKQLIKHNMFLDQNDPRLILSKRICNLKSNQSNNSNKPNIQNSSMDKKEKMSLSKLNERFYYSGIDKKKYDINTIKTNKKYTEYIILKRTKQKLALEKLKEYLQEDVLL